MGYQQILEAHWRIDKIFMVHKQVISPTGTVYFNWNDFIRLHDAGCELWNIHDVNCERCGTHIPFKKFPLDEIIEKFDLGYFSDTVCYMIAFALHQSTKGNKKDHTLKLKHPLKLRLYGVDMQDKAEYGQEKGGVECWIGYALGLGADVTISTGSTLLLTDNGSPYGFDTNNLKYLNPYTVLSTGDDPMSEEEFEARKDEITKTIEKMAKEFNPDIEKYGGECAKGLHRDTQLPSMEDISIDSTS